MISRNQPAYAKSKGFTLLEVMVAIGIFSFIGLASFQMLKSTAATNHRLTDIDAKIFTLQKAFSIISSDFTQLTARPVRDELGDEQPALTSNELDEIISFTRMGSAFFPGDEKLLVQRISYVLEASQDNESFGSFNEQLSLSLYRYIWPVLDLVEDVEPRKQLILEGVNTVDFQFYDHNGESYSDWPPEPDENSSEPEIEARRLLTALPIGMHITIESEPFGIIDRLFARAQVSLSSDQ